MEKKHTILIAGNDDTLLNEASSYIQKNGYSPILANSSEDVFAKLSKTKTDNFSNDFSIPSESLPGLIMIDINIDNDGHRLIRSLKNHEDYRNIPVLFIACCENTAAITRGYESGAVDYVTIPLKQVELNARIEIHLALNSHNETLDRLRIELAEANRLTSSKNEELKKLVEELDFATKIDFLTGLRNRKYIIEKIERLIKNGTPDKAFAVILADLDKFKSINDLYGHDCGDEVLKRVSEIFRSNVSSPDSVARWGGEEFIFVVGGMSKEGSISLAEKIRMELASAEMHYNGRSFNVTVTLGVSFINKNDTLSDIIKRADTALYLGKNNGRNRVEFVD